MQFHRTLNLVAIVAVCLVIRVNLAAIADDAGPGLAADDNSRQNAAAATEGESSGHGSFSLIWSFIIWRIAATDGEPLGHGYSRQGDHILFEGERIDEAGKEDIAEFAMAVGHPLTLCHDVDAASFRALSVEYTVDANHVYYRWISGARFWVVVLPDADPETFEVLDYKLARDADHVWRGDSPIPGADAQSAEVVRPHFVWKDQDRVYYQFSVISDADPDTFRHLDQAFYRDAQHVYWSDELLAQADPESFETYGDVPYARDKNHVWFGPRTLASVDAASFEYLEHDVFKDDRGVYVGEHALPIVDADVDSFEEVVALEYGCALFKDNSRFYVYDSAYSEVYTLELGDDSLIISKPAWRRQTPEHDPVQGATVSAVLTADGLSEPELMMEPGFENLDPPEYEKGKLQSREDIFREAFAIIAERADRDNELPK